MNFRKRFGKLLVSIQIFELIKLLDRLLAHFVIGIGYALDELLLQETSHDVCKAFIFESATVKINYLEHVNLLVTQRAINEHFSDHMRLGSYQVAIQS